MEVRRESGRRGSKRKLTPRSSLGHTSASGASVGRIKVAAFKVFSMTLLLLTYISSLLCLLCIVPHPRAP